jgi:hypothetical protein
MDVVCRLKAGLHEICAATEQIGIFPIQNRSLGMGRRARPPAEAAALPPSEGRAARSTSRHFRDNPPGLRV